MQLVLNMWKRVPHVNPTGKTVRIELLCLIFLLLSNTAGLVSACLKQHM